MAIQTIRIELKVDVSSEGRQALVDIAREQAIALRNAATFISAGRYPLRVTMSTVDNYFDERVISLEEAGIETSDDAGEP